IRVGAYPRIRRLLARRTGGGAARALGLSLVNSEGGTMIAHSVRRRQRRRVSFTALALGIGMALVGCVTPPVPTDPSASPSLITPRPSPSLSSEPSTSPSESPSDY